MRIGISIRSVEVNEKQTYILYKRYIEYFKDEEIILLLPNQSKELLDLCDGFILTGGDDLNPKLYNEQNTKSNDIDDEIDSLDIMIIDYAYKKNKVLLGICRGIQSINVYFNGTLKQDFKNHMKVNHKIKKVSNPRLFDIGYEIIVNSYHHQTINKIGNGLKATYCSSDGVVEIIEHEEKNIIGVQYHPEINIDNNSVLLFELFKSCIICRNNVK